MTRVLHVALLAEAFALLLWLILTLQIIVRCDSSEPGIFVKQRNRWASPRMGAFNCRGDLVLGYWDHPTKFRCNYALILRPQDLSVAVQTPGEVRTVLRLTRPSI